MRDVLSDLRAIFTPLAHRLHTGVPTAVPVRYERTEDGAPVNRAQAGLMAALPHRTLVGSEIQDYADEVLRMPWPRWRTGPVPPVLVRLEPTPFAYYDSGVVTVPRMVSELVVLHELAHHLGPRDHSGPFVAAYLDLVEHVMNPAAAHVFREWLTAEGVSLS